MTFVTHHHHGFDASDQGRMFAFLGIVMAIVQGGFVRRVKAGKEKSVAFFVSSNILIFERDLTKIICRVLP